LNTITKQTHKTPQTLDELVTALCEEERTKFDDIIRSMKLPTSINESLCSWCDDTYTRNCIFENEKFELILICWEAGQFTPIHDHGGEECWVKVLEGEFKESIYKLEPNGKLVNVKSVISKKGDITYMIDFMGFHRLENLSNKRSISLHLYAKPIHDCQIFDEDSKKFVSKKMVYDTVSELETS
jgi:cysteine dioxygenase